jgi:hypothetical protein
VITGKIISSYTVHPVPSRPRLLRKEPKEAATPCLLYFIHSHSHVTSLPPITYHIKSCQVCSLLPVYQLPILFHSSPYLANDVDITKEEITPITSSSNGRFVPPPEPEIKKLARENSNLIAAALGKPIQASSASALCWLERR